MPVKLAPFSATPSPATTPRATLRTPRAAATMSPPKSPPKSPRVPVLPFLSAAADAPMAGGASANFFQGLRVSPRKPYVVPPPKLRERHGSPLRDNSPGRMRDMPPALGETNEADDSAPLELMKDTSWILFPNMQVHHPYDVDVEGDKLTPGSTPHAELIQTLRKVKLLRSLSDEDLVALFRAGKQKVYPRYSSIVREGARCSTCYVLLHGQAVAHSSKQGLSGQLLARGTSFGEGALVTPVQREASVSALTHCLLFMGVWRHLNISSEADEGKSGHQRGLVADGGENIEHQRHLTLDDVERRVVRLPFHRLPLRLEHGSLRVAEVFAEFTARDARRAKTARHVSTRLPFRAT